MAAPATAAARLRLAGFLLWALATQFMIVIMVAASVAPTYDLAGGAISDLGHRGTERMIVYPAMLWMIAFGGYLMADDLRRG